MPRAMVSSRIQIEYEVKGSGPALLLISGLGAQLISWDDSFRDLLVDRGYTVIRYDNRDSGLSTILEELGAPDLLGLLVGGGSAPYGLDDMVDDALGLLDHLGIERAHVLGLSLGGMIAQLLALRRPDRVVTVVAALSGPPGRPSGLPSASVVEALLRAPGVTVEEKVEAAVELRRAFAGDGLAFDAVEARRRAVAQIERAHQPAGAMRQAAAVLATPNRLEELRRLRVPTLVIHGERDPLVPYASAKAAAEAIPDATFIGVPGLGHDLPAAVASDLIERISDFHSDRVAEQSRQRPSNTTW